MNIELPFEKFISERYYNLFLFYVYFIKASSIQKTTELSNYSTTNNQLANKLKKNKIWIWFKFQQIQ